MNDDREESDEIDFLVRYLNSDTERPSLSSDTSDYDIEGASSIIE